jgi:RNA polymerase sigma-70 factor (ECF subfamily)
MPSPLDEKKILATYKTTKDLRLLEQLYLAYQPFLFRHCMKILKNAEDSEDACVDLFLILKDKLLTHQVSHFSSWLFVVSRNHCLKKLAKKARFIFESEENIQETSEIFDSEDHIGEMLEKLPEAIDQLQESQRWCIVLFYLQGKSYKEIESIKGYSFKKIKSSIQHGKKNLRKLIGDEKEPI